MSKVTITIKSILENGFFTIPKNQRGYNWTNKEIQDYIDDLYINDQNHFMGTLIVNKDKNNYVKKKSGELPNYNIQDGQQRITTIIILLFGLMEKLKSLDSKHRLIQDIKYCLYYEDRSGNLEFRYRNDNNEFDAIIRHLLVDPKKYVLPKNSTSSTRAMEAAVKKARKNFEKYDVEKCDHLIRRIIENTYMLILDLDDEDFNQNLVFDSINSRGLELKDLDKIKNLCMLIHERRTLKVDPSQSWFDALHSLDEFFLSERSHEQDFISELYQVYHDKSVPEGNIYTDFSSRYKTLIQKSNSKLQSELEGFIKFWKDYAHSFAFLCAKEVNRKPNYFGILCSDDAGQHIDRIHNMNLFRGITRPIMICAHINYNTQKEFAEIAKFCEIYTFRNYAVYKGKRKDSWKSEIRSLSHSMLSGKEDPKSIKKKFCSWINKDGGIENMIRFLSDKSPKYPSKSGWTHHYYFLYEYEFHLTGNYGKYPWNPKKKDSVEHILPKGYLTGKKPGQSWWKSQWPDEREQKEYTHRLGNLVLTNGNSILATHKIEKKINGPLAYHYNSTNATIAEQNIHKYSNLNHDEWLKENILKREKELIKWACTRWSLQCKCDNNTYEMDKVYKDNGVDHEITISDGDVEEEVEEEEEMD